MGVNSLPKTVTRQRRDCDLNLDPSVEELVLPTPFLVFRRNALAQAVNWSFLPLNLRPFNARGCT